MFFELPISLQAEIFDCVWTHPTPPHKSVTMEKLLPTSSTTPTSPVQCGDFVASLYDFSKAANVSPEVSTERIHFKKAVFL